MPSLTHQRFEQWLETYGKASQENDPQTSAALFAPDAAYYVSPFEDPMVGRDAIYQYWDRGARNLKDKTSSFEILAVNGQLGIARWQSKFTVTESGKQFALDCLFVAAFDENGKCCEFREWWHHQEISDEQNS